ncbi:hypothetical protein BC835DRAFT_1481263 [Cytidiella melzeri]|nr:hypothetical protein BC835DRAFT_1481263 [Cytidiella melzeri]
MELPTPFRSSSTAVTLLCCLLRTANRALPFHIADPNTTLTIRARQAAAQAAAEGDAEAAAAMDMIDMGFGLEIWEKEKERENWEVADWTEENEQNMSGQTYEWIRIGADFEWIANISFDHKDYTWVFQIQRDRDVVAQYENSAHSLVFEGYHSVEEDVANCSHLQYIHEDGSRHKLLLPYTLRSSSSSRHRKQSRSSSWQATLACLEQVADQAKDLVKKWKQTVEQAKLQNGKVSASSGASKPQGDSNTVPVCCSFHTYHTQRFDTGNVSPQTVGRDKLKERWPSARAAFILHTYVYGSTVNCHENAELNGGGRWS